MIVIQSITDSPTGPITAAQVYTSANESLRPGSRCTVTVLDDESEVLHRGVVVYVKHDRYGVRIDGERVVHEWPAERVWCES